MQTPYATYTKEWREVRASEWMLASVTEYSTLSVQTAAGLTRYLPWGSYLLEKFRVANIVVKIAPYNTPPNIIGLILNLSR